MNKIARSCIGHLIRFLSHPSAQVCLFRARNERPGSRVSCLPSGSELGFVLERCALPGRPPSDSLSPPVSPGGPPSSQQRLSEGPLAAPGRGVCDAHVCGASSHHSSCLCQNTLGINKGPCFNALTPSSRPKYARDKKKKKQFKNKAHRGGDSLLLKEIP